MTSTAFADATPPALEAVAAAHAALDSLAQARLWAMRPREVGALVIELERLARRVGAAQMTAIAQADAVGVAAAEGASSTAARLREATDTPIGVGRGRLALQEALRRPAVAQ